MSHVYVPGGGLVGVEVAGGEVRLAPGETDGWIASEIIRAKPGYRYDFVLLETNIPGNSSVQISVLNATKESSQIGYANETIVGFERVEATYLSVYSIDPVIYPEVRIQVNLVADGTDRPTLEAWSLYYVPIDEWRDDFLGPWKMTDSGGLNFTGETLEVNTTSKSGAGPGGYAKYPPLAASGGPTLYYPNSGHDDYQDGDNLAIADTGPKWGIAYGDMNNDGFLDILLACRDWSYILWGNETGQYSENGATKIASHYYMSPGTGDFNGDGWTDIAFSGKYPSSGATNRIYLNRGDGTFNSTHDISFSTSHQSTDVGDINNDGYDDVMFGKEGGSASVYFGGPGGPDTTRDILFPGGNFWTQELVDLNNDGYLDVFLGSVSLEKLTVYFGDAEGIDTTPEFTFDLLNPFAGGVGDINGDGYTDLVVYAEDSGSNKIHIYEGDAQGWSPNRIHKTAVMTGLPGMVVADVDKDGYDDIMITATYQGAGGVHLFYGGPSWPTTPDATKTGGGGSLAIAIPRGSSGGTRTFRGTFTTETIDLPSNNKWKWDMVNLEGTLPKNTSMRISILDDSDTKIDGYADLEEWNVDIIDIDPDVHDTIKVRVDLTSEFNNTTPVLDLLTVKWMDRNTWRDQFYGDARIDRIMGVDVMDGQLKTDTSAWTSPQLIFSSLRNDSGYNVKGKAFFDQGPLGFLGRPPLDFNAKGTEAIDIADANGDGFMDAVFAVYQTSDTNFAAKSPLFFNSAIGWRSTADHTFPTTGARDVLLRDLNDDGHTDVVFAQEQDNGDFFINSTLFLGSVTGWNTTPDVEFVTTGASGVEASDIDGDGDLDLVFACYRSSTTSTDSMVFLQGSSGFDGSTADHLLATQGARAVATGDIDGDTRTDVVFANSFSGGLAGINSWIYWGKAGGGFETATANLPTLGAEDVKVADLDGDTDLDIIFANAVDNSGDKEISSYVYRNDGSGGFAAIPDATLPTIGASAVSVGDLDGTGWKDLVFANHKNRTSFSVPSVVYLGGLSGWSSTPDIELPTEGASDVMVAQLTKVGYGGYMSKAITPMSPSDTGSFHTFRYTSIIGGSQTARIQLIDASTEEVLAETPMLAGTNEWVVDGIFRVKEHPSIRVLVAAEGLDKPGTFELDDLWLNWTKRVRKPPVVLDLSLESPSVYRTNMVKLWMNATDEYDPPWDLRVVLQHRLNGTANWETNMMRPMTYAGGPWTTDITPRVETDVGSYDFRVRLEDSDRQDSGFVEFPNMLEVLNNLPTTPEVRITPARPVTTNALSIEIVDPSRDVESSGLTYRYQWYLDGVLQENLTGDNVDASYTRKGQNWSVEVRGHDGDDGGDPGFAWRMIENAAPVPTNLLPNPMIDEDTEDTDWLDLSTAFEDPDGDTITWTVNPTPQHIEVGIDAATGKVTLRPEANWNGAEDLTFIASDGEHQATQTVTVTVTPVNDIPRFGSVNGKAVSGGTVTFTIKQGELLTIDVLVIDPEGDELIFSANTSLINLDSETGAMSFQPDNDAVGTLRFGLKVWDMVSPDEKVTLNFRIVVENENDPMDDPRITNPRDGDKFDANMTFSLIAICTDPDTQYGQVLNYSWSSNISGHLGYGSSLTISIVEPGVHLIMLTVTDGEFEKTEVVGITIEPEEVIIPPPPDNGNGDGKEPLNYGLIVGIIVVLVIVGASLYVMTTKRRTEEEEAADEEEYKREHMERAHEAVKAAADHLEAGKEEWEETPETTTVALEDVEVEVESSTTPSMSLSMEAKKTKTADEATMALFADDKAAEPAMSDEDREELRIENLKRNYQNAIGRLPYGIPSSELQDWDWVNLAAALATGEKRMSPEGQETTKIDGRWYYSDAKDTGSFLKEHGAKPKAAPKKKSVEVTTDKEDLLAKLEERFILGEISEEAYNKLVEKYSKD
jgi:hypothetical protein